MPLRLSRIGPAVGANTGTDQDYGGVGQSRLSHNAIGSAWLHSSCRIGFLGVTRWQAVSSGRRHPIWRVKQQMSTRLLLVLARRWHRPGPVFGDPRLAPYRLGQSSFKAVVLDAYNRRCAITGTHIPPVLQAAHIRPVTAGGEHRLDNGLLLRSDIHTLFDRGYLGIDPQFRLRVSPKLRADFNNGEQLYAMAGQVIELPERRADRPSREFLQWHLDELFHV